MKTRGFSGAQYRVRQFAQNSRVAVEQVLADGADTIEQRMKSEHKWQNRTGAAEANLFCHVMFGAQDTYKLVAGHGVTYGKDLETMQGGRFRVVFPTMRSEWPRIKARLAAQMKQQAGA